MLGIINLLNDPRLVRTQRTSYGHFPKPVPLLTTFQVLILMFTGECGCHPCQSSFFLQQMKAITKAHNSSKCREQLAMQCPSPVDVSATQPTTQATSQKRNRKTAADRGPECLHGHLNKAWIVTPCQFRGGTSHKALPQMVTNTQLVATKKEREYQSSTETSP